VTFVTKQLGAKVCMFGSGVRRIPHAKGAPPTSPLCQASISLASTASTTTLLWRSAASSASRDLPYRRRSYASATADQLHLTNIGHFAAAAQRRQGAVPRGVTRRFPDLASLPRGRRRWGCQLFCDLVEHGRRGAQGGEHGPDQSIAARALVERRLRRYRRRAARRDAGRSKRTSHRGCRPRLLRCNIAQKQDWTTLRHPYYFAASRRPDERGGVRQGSGMGRGIQRDLQLRYRHFDVVDMRDPLPERSSCRGRPSPKRFPRLRLRHAVGCGATQNPRFFEGRRWQGSCGVLKLAPALRAAPEIAGTRRLARILLTLMAGHAP